SANQEDADFELEPDPDTIRTASVLAANLGIQFPSKPPVPKEINPKPDPNAALPKADVVVVTWTVDEVRALADVLTPGFTRDHWYRSDRNFNHSFPNIA